MGGTSVCLYTDRSNLSESGEIMMLEGEVIGGIKSLGMWE